MIETDIYIQNQEIIRKLDRILRAIEPPEPAWMNPWAVEDLSQIAFFHSKEDAELFMEKQRNCKPAEIKEE